MKISIIICLFFSSIAIFSAENNKTASALKIEDLKNNKIDSTSTSTNSQNLEGLSANEQKKLQEAVINYKNKIEENHQVLEELDNEDK